jgi:hypothetical protein
MKLLKYWIPAGVYPVLDTGQKRHVFSIVSIFAWIPAEAGIQELIDNLISVDK